MTKRKRIPLSCSACRKKKIRCDRVRPVCSGCTRSASTCVFEEGSRKNSSINVLLFRSEAPKNPNSNELNFLTPIQFTDPESSAPQFSPPPNQPIQKYDDVVVDFHSEVVSIHMVRPKSRVFNVSPLSGLSIAQRDYYGRIVFHGLFRFFKGVRSLAQARKTSKDFESLKIRERNLFIQKALDDIPDRMLEFSVRIHEYAARRHSNLSVSILTSFCELISQDALLAADIEMLLPSKPVIYMYIDRFFKFVYPVYPLMDEASFRADVAKLIGPDSVGPAKINFSNEDSHLDAATLLIVLKLAFLIVYSHSIEPLPEDVRVLKSYPITAPLYDLAKACLARYEFMHRCGFQLLLTLYYFQVYHSVGYEEGGDTPGGVETSILGETLMSAARSIGLHRDPFDNMSNFLGIQTESVKFLMLWRKAWHTLIALDAESVMSSGNPPRLNPDYANTEIPKLEDLLRGSNCSDLNVERVVISAICKKLVIVPLVRKIADLVNRMNNPPSIGELMPEINFLSKHLREKFRKYSDYVDDIRSRSEGLLPRYDYSATMKLVICTKEHFLLAEFLSGLKAQIFVLLEKAQRFPRETELALLDAMHDCMEDLYVAQFWTIFGRLYVLDYELVRCLYSTSRSMLLRRVSGLFVGVLVRMLCLRHSLTRGSQLLREEILDKTIILYKVYSRMAQQILAVCVVTDTSADMFYMSFKNQIGMHQCLRSITAERNDPEYGITGMLSLYLQNPATHERLFSSQATRGDFKNLMAILDLCRNYSRLTHELETVTGENVLGEDFSQTQRGPEEVDFKLDLEVMSFYQRTETVTQVELADFWDLLFVKDISEGNMRMNRYLKKIKGSRGRIQEMMKLLSSEGIPEHDCDAAGSGDKGSIETEVSTPFEPAPLPSELESLMKINLLGGDEPFMNYFNADPSLFDSFGQEFSNIFSVRRSS